VMQCILIDSREKRICSDALREDENGKRNDRFNSMSSGVRLVVR
jgi:hypothetical protein